jgi:hypothetical protein
MATRFVRHSRWLLVVALFAVCVAAKLNGSSIGVWQSVLREPGPTRGLLCFKPQPIRGDEWAHITPSILAQINHSPQFPIENVSLGGGRSPLLMSVPVAYYTTFFRPQLWGFFFFDIEHAFSFYWCFKIFGLLLATAWLLKQIGINSRAIICFGTIWLFFSSFVQWWFSTPAMLPEMLASWAMLTGCALRMFVPAKPWQHSLAIGGFIFFGINFALCMYPGFQVPLLYVSMSILLGVAIDRSETQEWGTKRGLVLLGIALVLTALVLLPFWFATRDTLRMVASTAYPGVYRNSGGGLKIVDVFSGAFGFFESDRQTPLHYENICEASNFYPLWPVALGMLTIPKWRKRTPMSPLILALAVVITLLGIYCVVPMPAWLAHASLLGLTTESRLLLGIGIANILLCCVFLDRFEGSIITHARIVAVVAAALTLIIGLLWIHPYPENPRLNVMIVALNAVLIGSFFVAQQKQLWFLIPFAAAVFLNGVRINPVMSGLSSLLQSQAFRKIDNLHKADPNVGWIFYEDAQWAQLIKATGATVLNGAKILPEMDLMHELDPTGSSAEIYNRFAFINVGIPDEGNDVVFVLTSFNGYQFSLPPEHEALLRRNYQYVVFPRPWLNASLHGFHEVDAVPASDIYIYKRDLTTAP